MESTYPSVGLTDECVTFFLARGLTKTGQGGGVDGEDITVHEIALDSLHDWLAEKKQNGLSTSIKIFAGLYLASIQK